MLVRGKDAARGGTSRVSVSKQVIENPAKADALIDGGSNKRVDEGGRADGRPEDTVAAAACGEAVAPCGFLLSAGMLEPGIPGRVRFVAESRVIATAKLWSGPHRA
ncbi:MAG: hypothetical protein VX000_14420, partial [Myxococcota bacterium]|nr:hypothetical protein [Myxococcota bacterium]